MLGATVDAQDQETLHPKMPLQLGQTGPISTENRRFCLSKRQRDFSNFSAADV